MKVIKFSHSRSVFASLSVFCVALLLLAPSSAEACRCAQQSLAEYYAKADVVMQARVAGVSDPTDDAAASVTAQVLPAKQYKGRSLTKIRTPGSSAECGFELVAGQQLWVFASLDGSQNVGRVDTCSGTRLVNSDFSDVRGDDVGARLASMLRERKSPTVKPVSENSRLREEILGKIEIKQIVRDFGSEGTMSPAGTYRFALENPPPEQPRPMVSNLRVDHARDYQLVVTLHGIEPDVAARWINDAHIQIDATWTPDIVSEIVVDVEQESVIETRIVETALLP